MSSVDEVSFFVHNHYLYAALGKGMRVLEVGAGEGAFTREISKVGCTIVIAESSEARIGINRRAASRLGFGGAVEGWRLLESGKLRASDSDSFDAVVSLGASPETDCDSPHPDLAECVRVCKPGGIILLSALSYWGAVHGYLKGTSRGLLPVESVPEGELGAEPGSWTEARGRCRVFRARELREAALGLGVEVTALSASNALSVGWGSFLPELRSDPERWHQCLELELKTCREEACLDMGSRIILVGRKPGTQKRVEFVEPSGEEKKGAGPGTMSPTLLGGSPPGSFLLPRWLGSGWPLPQQPGARWPGSCM